MTADPATLPMHLDTTLDFIRRYYRQHRRGPTIRQIMLACRLHSTSAAAYRVTVLQRRGYIRRDPGVACSIRPVTQG